ncbi:MAG TPA: glycosyltransferase family 39 protein [Gemmatimonas sp.]|uniref:glycosyltransferase family 39 protein n=1 Tax=Gemmatimonas sp. TaxID=1962908 RepID=UPI002ED7CDAC
MSPSERDHRGRERLMAWIPAVLAVVSLIVWMSQSRAVVLWREQALFLRTVLRDFWTNPVLYPVPFTVPTAPSDAMAALVGAIACLMAALLIARRFRGSSIAAPMGLLAAMSVAIVPPMLLATAGWPDGNGWLSGINIAIAQVGGAACAALLAWAIGRSGHTGRVVLTTHVPADVPRDGDPSGALILLLTSCAVITWTIVLIAGLSGIFGYDSFSDHIARPARWLITGRLEPGVAAEVVTFYPGNFELLVRWLLAFGSDRLAFLAAYASSLGAIWVVYRLAREIGQSGRAAALSALAAASLQVLAYQSMVVYSDTFTALCLLLATWILLVWRREGATNRWLTAGFGAALGLAMGAKYSAGPPAVVLGLFWAWYASRGQPSEDFEQPLVDIRALVSQLPWLIVSALPGMIFWYLRNAVREGNPFYPLSVAGLPGIPLPSLLAGAPGPRTLFERLTYPWFETGHILGFETGLGATVATVGVLALVLGLWTGRGSAAHRLLWMVLLASTVAWARTGVLVPRYGLYPILLSFVFVGALVTRYPTWLLRMTTAVAILISLGGVSYHLAGVAAYNMVFHESAAPVPPAIASLPPSRIVNLAGQPSGYYAMGPDYRHRVLTPFQHYLPADVQKLDAQYLLLPEAREGEFVGVFNLRLVERWKHTNAPSTALWRIE